MTFNKEVLDSFWLTKKQQALFPFQFLLAKLSFVRMTPLFRYHINIFILRGIFICQISCVAFKPLMTRCLYIKLTVNAPLLCIFHINKSIPSFRLICTRLATRVYHLVKLSSTKALLKEILSGRRY
jgi:hypothetical protein